MEWTTRSLFFFFFVVEIIKWKERLKIYLCCLLIVTFFSSLLNSIVDWMLQKNWLPRWMSPREGLCNAYSFWTFDIWYILLCNFRSREFSSLTSTHSVRLLQVKSSMLVFGSIKYSILLINTKRYVKKKYVSTFHLWCV